MTTTLIVSLALAAFIIVLIAKTAVVVPQQNAYVVERLGKFHNTLDAGFHILLPFLDLVHYKHSLKERAVDIQEQICITRDNVQVGVDGVLYHQGHGSAARVVRCGQLHLRHQPAGPDDAA